MASHCSISSWYTCEGQVEILNRKNPKTKSRKQARSGFGAGRMYTLLNNCLSCCVAKLFALGITSIRVCNTQQPIRRRYGATSNNPFGGRTPYLLSIGYLCNTLQCVCNLSVHVEVRRTRNEAAVPKGLLTLRVCVCPDYSGRQSTHNLANQAPESHRRRAHTRTFYIYSSG